MTSKKRMWSEEEIRLKMDAVIVITIVISVIFSMIATYLIIGYHYGDSWQPINCVNETKEMWFVEIQENTCQHEPYKCSTSTLAGFYVETYDEAYAIEFEFAHNYFSQRLYPTTVFHANIERRAVPTGRQICSQKMLVKNETSVI